MHLEAGVVREPLRLGLAGPRLLRVPRGTGRPVLDLPGWRTSEHSLVPLRTFLRTWGHRAESWGMGTNTGDVEGFVPKVVGRVEAMAERTGDTPALVGWSLGGVIAREVARLRPDLVRRVITFGSPLIGTGAYTFTAGQVPQERRDRWVDAYHRHEQANPIQVPVTTIFTRRDRVVAWPACIDHHSPDVEHVEVTSTHVGLGLDPDVWRVVADRLTLP